VGQVQAPLAAPHGAVGEVGRERCLYLAHEESPEQILRNMASLGVDLRTLDPELFHLRANRPTLYGLEMHLAVLHRVVNQLDPQVVIIDPVTSLTPMGEVGDVRLMLTRLIDFLKLRGVTSLFTSLLDSELSFEANGAGVSSLIDTWIRLHNHRGDGKRVRALEVLKSRGMAHGEELNHFRLTDEGLRFDAPAARSQEAP
jgi:circadian clock protein KaiC